MFIIREPSYGNRFISAKWNIDCSEEFDKTKKFLRSVFSLNSYNGGITPYLIFEFALGFKAKYMQ